MCTRSCCPFFFFNDTATTEIYTLSLHDALPISRQAESTAWAAASSAPVAETPAPAMPSREPVSQPAAPAADARLDDEHEMTPAWRKFLEKLAGTFDPRSADPVPPAARERPVSPTPD